MVPRKMSQKTPEKSKEKKQCDEINTKLKLEDRVKNEIFGNYQQQQQQQASTPLSTPQKTNNSFLNNFRSSSAAVTNNNNINNKGHKRQDSDSKLSLNFVRGFRRENSDFFPLSKRHSAVLGERQTGQQNSAAAALGIPARSSGIFQRSSNIGKSSVAKGEPILTDFSSNNNNNSCSSSTSSGIVIGGNDRNFDFLRPRREKTESVILVRNSATRQQLLEKLQQVNHSLHPHFTKLFIFNLLFC